MLIRKIAVFPIVVLFALSLCLAGCSGGGGGADEDAVVLYEQMAHSGQPHDAQRLFERLVTGHDHVRATHDVGDRDHLAPGIGRAVGTGSFHGARHVHSPCQCKAGPRARTLVHGP